MSSNFHLRKIELIFHREEALKLGMTIIYLVNNLLYVLHIRKSWLVTSSRRRKLTMGLRLKRTNLPSLWSKCLRSRKRKIRMLK